MLHDLGVLHVDLAVLAADHATRASGGLNTENMEKYLKKETNYSDKKAKEKVLLFFLLFFEGIYFYCHVKWQGCKNENDQQFLPLDRFEAMVL